MAKASSDRRTAGNRSNPVARWKRSGLSASVFGEREGVPPRWLYWLRWEAGKEGVPKAVVGLVPVTIVGDGDSGGEEAETSRCRWKIRFPDGMSVEMTGPNSVCGGRGRAPCASRRSGMMFLPKQIFVPTGPVDMRLSFDRLAGIARRRPAEKPCSSSTMGAGPT